MAKKKGLPTGTLIAGLGVLVFLAAGGLGRTTGFFRDALSTENTGEAGAAGAAGAQGSDGVDGVDGAQGAQGAPGRIETLLNTIQSGEGARNGAGGSGSPGLAPPVINNKPSSGGGPSGGGNIGPNLPGNSRGLEDFHHTPADPTKFGPPSRGFRLPNTQPSIEPDRRPTPTRPTSGIRTVPNQNVPARGTLPPTTVLPLPGRGSVRIITPTRNTPTRSTPTRTPTSSKPSQNVPTRTTTVPIPGGRSVSVPTQPTRSTPTRSTPTRSTPTRTPTSSKPSQPRATRSTPTSKPSQPKVPERVPAAPRTRSTRFNR